MNFLTFWGLILIGAIIILAGTIFLSYWIPKKLGNKKLGIALSLILTTALFLLTSLTVFKDHLFFKSDAKEFLSKYDINLNDDFKITYNDSDEILDAYQKFNLEISPTDRLRIIEAIKTSENFGKSEFIKQADNSTGTVNYEVNNLFVRKSRQTFGSNEVVIIEVIEVDKEKNRLTCYKYIP